MSGGGRYVRVYHEKQVAGLCGVHCLNTLLQGSAFTEVELAHIAQRLDDQEKQAMASCGTNTEEYLRFLSESSGNVAEDGNYSIQVLQEALKIWDLQCFSLGSEDARIPRPGQTPAYICNLLSHWLTVRNVGGTWVNLNSLLDKPQRLSESYLALFLQTLQSRGYSIFVVYPHEGAIWPAPPQDSSRGDWVTLDLTLPPQNEPAIPSEKEQLELAIAESLSAQETLPGAVQHSGLGSNELDEDTELSQALYLSILDSQSQTQPTATTATVNNPQPTERPSLTREVITILDDVDEHADDEELAQALRLSLTANDTATHIPLNLPNQPSNLPASYETRPQVSQEDEELEAALRLSLLQ